MEHADQVTVNHQSDAPGNLAGCTNLLPVGRWFWARLDCCWEPVPGKAWIENRWALDHLFLDHEGVPTFVEVKRSSDSRIRREVVGQMLDYAANAVVYWSPDMARRRFESDCEVNGDDPQQLLEDSLGQFDDYEEFLRTVAGNMALGRVRMIFVADEIPPELRRIIEFLNEQMSPAEVLVVEVKQYTGLEQRALVSSVIGQTQRTIVRKNPGIRKPVWESMTDAQVQATIPMSWNAEQAEIVTHLATWASDRLLTLRWRNDQWAGLFISQWMGRSHQVPFSAKTNGDLTVEILGRGGTKAPFDSSEARRTLVDRLNAIDGRNIPAEACETRMHPSFPLTVLSDETNQKQFFEVFDWAIQELRQAN